LCLGSFSHIREERSSWLRLPSVVSKVSLKTFRTHNSPVLHTDMWTGKSRRGVLQSAPMRREPHPGIKGWLPPYDVPHAGLPLDLMPQAQQGTPRILFTRGGARPALTPRNAPPAVFAFLLSQVKRTPRGGPNSKALIAQSQPPIGVIH